MSPLAALPFFLKRTREVVGGEEITSTTERIHGLLRLGDEQLIVQWRVAREIDRVGEEIRTDHEFDAVREVSLPLKALASATIRERWFSGPQIVLTASDLRTFEEITGATGLQLEHPATLELRLHRGDRLTAREFAADLNVALAECALQSSTGRGSLTRGLSPEVRDLS